ncbi:Uncharacterised protein [Neisseria meningitidis]|nr:Uncharacterised protein [Neisseria meningitidis]CWQ76436.1 Uncharacterised protein [Neisseria meningitidis]
MFGKQLDLMVAAQCRQRQFFLRCFECVDVPRPRQKQPFALALPSGLAQQRPFQRVQAVAGFRRQRDDGFRARTEPACRVCVQIGFAVDFDAFQLRRQRVQNRPCLVVHAFARIDQHQRDIGFGYGFAAAFDADAFDHVVRLAQTCRIDNMHRNAVNQDTFPDRVARRSGNIGNNRHFVARQRVQQAGFADIRRADQYDIQTFAQNRALLRVGKHIIHGAAQAVQFAACVCRFEKINVFLGKI